MRIGRSIVIPTILALGVAASALAGAKISAAAEHAPSTHVEATAASTSPNTLYRG
jgi:hypothetical protein